MSARRGDETVTLETFTDSAVRIEANVNPVDGSIEINRCDGEVVTDGIRLSMAAILLLEPLLTKHVAATIKKTRRTRSALRAWAKRMHARR